jgi:hypothetical protein
MAMITHKSHKHISEKMNLVKALEGWGKVFWLLATLSGFPSQSPAAYGEQV